MTDRTRRFGKFVAVPDGIGTSTVLDRETDQPVKEAVKLPAKDAEKLARDWSKSAKRTKAA